MAQFVYATILEHIVKPALLESTQVSWGVFWGPAANTVTTHTWLSSILDNKMFNEEHAYVAPKVFQANITSYASVTRVRDEQINLEKLWKDFKQRVVCAPLRSSSTLPEDIELNIAWKQYLHSLQPDQSRMLLALFKSLIESNSVSAGYYVHSPQRLGMGVPS